MDLTDRVVLFGGNGCFGPRWVCDKLVMVRDNWAKNWNCLSPNKVACDLERKKLAIFRAAVNSSAEGLGTRQSSIPSPRGAARPKQAAATRRADNMYVKLFMLDF